MRWWNIAEILRNIEQEKKKRILTASYKEFSEQGYERASTNKIVKEAGIGKGMLFYYFKSKKDLYHYLVEYGINFISNEYLNKIDEIQTDYIEKYKQVSKIKMEAYSENPEIFNFFAFIYLNGDILDLPEELKNKLEAVRALGYSKLYHNIDTSLFRTDISKEKILKLIHWSMEGYEKEMTNRLKGQALSSIEIEPLWSEFYDYLDDLKTIFYN